MRAICMAASLAMVMAFAAGCERRSGGAIQVKRVDPPQGVIAGGDQVVIEGAGFQPGKTQVEVRFGRRKADNVIIASNNEIAVVTPPGDRGPIDVSVMFDDGQAFKIPSGFTYVEPQNTGSVRQAWEKNLDNK